MGLYPVPITFRALYVQIRASDEGVLSKNIFRTREANETIRSVRWQCSCLICRTGNKILLLFAKQSEIPLHMDWVKHTAVSIMRHWSIASHSTTKLDFILAFSRYHFYTVLWVNNRFPSFCCSWKFFRCFIIRRCIGHFVNRHQVKIQEQETREVFVNTYVYSMNVSHQCSEPTLWRMKELLRVFESFLGN